jgi:hypothetical protein
MSMPARASARLVAAPKPEEAPRTSAQPESRIGSASVIIVARLLVGETREHSTIPA